MVQDSNSDTDSEEIAAVEPLEHEPQGTPRQEFPDKGTMGKTGAVR